MGQRSRGCHSGGGTGISHDLKSALLKVHIETRVKYRDPDIARREELKAETREANRRQREWVRDMQEAEKVEPFIYPNLKGEMTK